MSDGLFTMAGLLGAMANGPSNQGERSDGKICTAQAGECRYNHKYYSPGMRDSKSWSMPCADDSCPDKCCYLDKNERYMGTQEERFDRVNSIVDSFENKHKSDKLMTGLVLGMMGVDPRDILE